MVGDVPKQLAMGNRQLGERFGGHGYRVDSLAFVAVVAVPRDSGSQSGMVGGSTVGETGMTEL